MSKNWEQEARQLNDRCNQLRRQPEKVESDLTQEDVAGVTADFKACLAERNEAREQRDALQALKGGWTAQQVADYLATAVKACVVLERERDEARDQAAWDATRADMAEGRLIDAMTDNQKLTKGWKQALADGTAGGHLPASHLRHLACAAYHGEEITRRKLAELLRLSIDDAIESYMAWTQERGRPLLDAEALT